MADKVLIFTDGSSRGNPGPGGFGVSTNSLTSYREEGQLYQINYIHPKSNTRLLASVSDDIPTDLLTGSMIMG